MDPVKIFIISILAFICSYLFLGYRFQDRQFVEVELRYLESDMFFSLQDKVTFNYEANLAIPFINMVWAPEFIFSSYSAKGREKEYATRDFMDKSKAKSVILKIPVQISGFGLYQLSAVTFTRVTGLGQSSFTAGWIKDASAENIANHYLLVRGPIAIASNQYRDRDVLFRILNDEIRFSDAPDSRDYFMEKTGKIILSPAYEISAQEDSRKLVDIEKKEEGLDVLTKVKSHRFHGFEKLETADAKLFRLSSAFLEVISISSMADKDKNIFYSRYVFRRGQIWCLRLSKASFRSGSETKVFYFKDDKIVQPRYPFDQESSSEEGPNPQEIDLMLQDFNFLRKQIL